MNVLVEIANKMRLQKIVMHHRTQMRMEAAEGFQFLAETLIITRNTKYLYKQSDLISMYESILSTYSNTN
jgi:hypothetical protein